MKGARLALVVTLLGLAPSLAKDAPYLTGHVNDHAGMLSTESRDRLERALRDFEDSTGVQVVVLIESSLEGEPLEEYTLKVASEWKLGREGRDDGLLFYVAREDRKMRLEVGYGLEEKLPDGLCGRILDGYVVPRFRAGEHEAGIEGGVDAILSVLRGKPGLPPPPASSGFLERGATKPDLQFVLMFLGIFVVVIGLFSFLAVAMPEPVVFLYLFLMPFYLVFPLAALGPKAGLSALGFWVVAYPLARTLIHGRPFRRGRSPRWKWVEKMGSARGGSGSSSRWSGSRSSGGSSHSSSHSSFSGGGGGFGGGGASRSW